MSSSWVEISRTALLHNLRRFRELAPQSRLAPVVKANAYGHGLVEVARLFESGGADWLCTDSLAEAQQLRDAGVSLPLYVLGFVPDNELSLAARLPECRFVVYDGEMVRALSREAEAAGRVVPLHIKVETGNHRQGLVPAEAVELARLINALPGVTLEGASSHYADIEDTTDHTFASGQLNAFNEACQGLTEAGFGPRLRNFSNSAATILRPDTHFELVRVGISMYGMWPSKETLVSADMQGREKPDLRPALTWKTVAAQVKEVPAGRFVGYGRTWQTTRPTRLAVLPVGYWDGYDRRLSNVGHVLVAGSLAPVRGRVCMNMTMVDVTDMGPVSRGTEVVLLGRNGHHAVPAEKLAEWMHTINYEVTTRINPAIPRVLTA